MSHVLLENVGVDFVLFGANRNLRLSFLKGITGGRILPERLRGDSVVVKALDDISLELRSGDRVGLIGHNGAGKSTLLRVLAGIYHPTTGRMRIHGKVTPLLNLTPGLEMEDSGFENIITCGLLHGMTTDEITAKAPGIVEFSELGDYIHLPVRSYSSGMLARLSFSIATSLDPGILLLDEGIGAADAGFSEKASRKVKELIARTDILVLASHSEALVDSMCNKALLLDHGLVRDFGTVAEVTRSYHQMLAAT
jgi:ABC-type polysaccharide/polyol phosphate transport system ATPase subunit